MGMLLAIVFLIFAAPQAGAQIYEWRDSTGDRHFTNDPEDIPESLREGARVVVRARPAAAIDEAEVADADDISERDVEPRRARRARRDEPEPPRQAQVIYDHSFRFKRSPPQVDEPAPPAAPQVHVNIAGPLAVSQVVVPESPPVPFDYYYGGGIPLGLRPPVRPPPQGTSPPRRQPRLPSVLAPAPLGPGSPAAMPANMGSAGARR